jgi:hypothetical protein
VNMAAVTEVELIVPQGSTFIYEVTVRDPDTDLPMDITGYTAALDARVKIDDPSPVYSASSEGTNPDLEIIGATGKVRLTIPEPTTAAFTFKKVGFDLEIKSPTPENCVTKLVKGVWLLDKEWTRS